MDDCEPPRHDARAPFGCGPAGTGGRRRGRVTPRHGRHGEMGKQSRRSRECNGHRTTARDVIGTTGLRTDPEICAACRRARFMCGPLPCPFPFPFSFNSAGRPPSARGSSHGDAAPPKSQKPSTASSSPPLAPHCHAKSAGRQPEYNSFIPLCIDRILALSLESIPLAA